MDRVLESFDTPIKNTSDNGLQYAATVWQTLHHPNGTRTAYGQAYRARSIGNAESSGKTLESIFRKVSLKNGLPWLEVLPRALSAYNDLPGESGYSPYQLVFGRERIRRGPELPTAHQAEDVTALMERQRRADAALQERLQALQMRRKDTYDKRRLAPHF